MQEIDSQRQSAIGGALVEGLSKMIAPLCTSKGGSPRPSPPTWHWAVAKDGTYYKQPCGTIAEQVLTSSAIAGFIRDVCNGQDSPECGERLWKMFVARLYDRYTFAKWSWVINKCDAYPVQCKQWSNLEFWALQSHNDGVSQWTQKAMQSANVQYQEEEERAYEAEAERRRQIGLALQQVSASLAPAPTIQCVSNSVGTTTTTSCH